MQFTIHFATINTLKLVVDEMLDYKFTIHFATINTTIRHKKPPHKGNLQYTLLLLILHKIIFISFSYSIYNTLCYY